MRLGYHTIPNSPYLTITGWQMYKIPIHHPTIYLTWTPLLTHHTYPTLLTLPIPYNTTRSLAYSAHITLSKQYCLALYSILYLATICSSVILLPQYWLMYNVQPMYIADNPYFNPTEPLLSHFNLMVRISTIFFNRQSIILLWTKFKTYTSAL